ncbi:SixA phosphatase family protein [Sphingomonas phyllosphaerae]|uniref:SixA phosphatase family protein n=1 Tax=Sphingomonas phyllosphaerae TaxID=257003 RepID=UPI00241377BB|nr:histidine phosphatase family protein [Sphingomonas phyllosphaerae]
MKTLTLLRHAKSGWDDAVPRDLDRPLNPKGRRAAQAIGREIKAMGLNFDRVLASPAVRVRETIEEAERGLGRALAPEWDRRLYLASAATLLDVVHEQDDAAETLLLVGHNPGLEELVLALVPEVPGGLRDAVEEKYPTATLAEMTFAADGWREVTRGGATLTRFVRPRDIDATLGPDGE